MTAYKDSNGSLYASYFVTDYTGKRQRKKKRGFKTKKEAEKFIAKEMMLESRSMEMTFDDFEKQYLKDYQNRIKLNTMMTKTTLIEIKILPFFKDRRMDSIKVADIIAWQNELLDYQDVNGNKYSPIYLKTVHNQLSAIFNHAVNKYGLANNPARLAGNMGKEKTKEMLFQTKEEYLAFSKEMLDKEDYYYAFEILYWGGLRLGEVLALTVEDFYFEKETIRINKSIQRIKGEAVITDPKTPKSNRIVTMTKFVIDEVKSLIDRKYKIKPCDRVLNVTKSGLHLMMINDIKKAGVQRIRIHDLRHSHVSLLISIGFDVLEIANRVGHESTDITFRYAHMFPSKDKQIAAKLNKDREENFKNANEE